MKEDVINKLAEKLGVAVEVLWAALLKQAPVEAAVSAVVLAMWTVIAVAGWLLVKHLATKASTVADTDESCMYGVAAIICGIVVIIITIAAVSGYSNAAMILAGFFNPEYWALKQILN